MTTACSHDNSETLPKKGLKSANSSLVTLTLLSSLLFQVSYLDIFLSPSSNFKTPYFWQRTGQREGDRTSG